MVLSETRPPPSAPASAEATVARLRRLLDVSVALNTFTDPRRLLDYIVDTTCQVADCEAASILLFDETTGRLQFEAATGAAGAALIGTDVPLRRSLAGTTFCEDRVVHAADAAADARRFRGADGATGFVTRTSLCVPMRIDRRPVGVIQVLNARSGRFDRADAESLLILAAQGAVAIRHVRHEAELARANAKLAEIDRLKTNFMAITSHELRTPITAVQGFGEILAEEVRPDLRGFAAAVETAGARMLNVVETLDVMATVEGRFGTHPTTRVSLSDVLREVVAATAPSADLGLPPGGLVVEGVPRRLRIAFEHLLRNAVQFSAPDGHVRVSAVVDDGELRLAIEDDGRGLAAEDLERIFEGYVQVADPDRRDHEGLGVGLTVARSVMVQHGGRLWAESPGLGRGATFYVRLPLATGGGDGAA